MMALVHGSSSSSRCQSAEFMNQSPIQQKVIQYCDRFLLITALCSAEALSLAGVAHGGDDGSGGGSC